MLHGSPDVGMDLKLGFKQYCAFCRYGKKLESERLKNLIPTVGKAAIAIAKGSTKVCLNPDCQNLIKHSGVVTYKARRGA
jgi:hypothetical protein